jgi:hypothetical protein
MIIDFNSIPHLESKLPLISLSVGKTLLSMPTLKRRLSVPICSQFKMRFGKRVRFPGISSKLY